MPYCSSVPQLRELFRGLFRHAPDRESDGDDVVSVSRTALGGVEQRVMLVHTCARPSFLLVTETCPGGHQVARSLVVIYDSYATTSALLRDLRSLWSQTPLQHPVAVRGKP